MLLVKITAYGLNTNKYQYMSQTAITANESMGAGLLDVYNQGARDIYLLENSTCLTSKQIKTHKECMTKTKRPRPISRKCTEQRANDTSYYPLAMNHSA